MLCYSAIISRKGFPWQLGLIVRALRVLYQATLIARHFFVQSIRLTNHYPCVQISMVYGVALSVCQTYFPAWFYTCLITTWEFKIFATLPLGYGALIVMAPVGFEPTLTNHLWFYQVLLTIIFYIIIISQF